MIRLKLKNITLSLISLAFLLLLAGCNPSADSSDSNATGDGDSNGSENNDNNDDSQTVQLDYGAGFVLLSSPNPSQIALNGYATALIPGQTRFEVSVVDYDLQPVVGHTVNFSLTDTTGDSELTQASAVTDAEGSASTVLVSGSVQGTTQIEVRMNLVGPGGALIESNVLVATSLPISMHTAAPVTDGISLSADVYNPEGYNFDGVPVNITVHLNDMHRNPVADGTLVNFLASAGTIDPVCPTVSGACSIQWRSSNPRNDGRVDILARTNGNDAFVESNVGNSRFDLNEDYTPQGEPYVDANGNGQYDPGEFYWDLNQAGYSSADPGSNYKGYGCTAPALAAGHCAERAVVFSNITIVSSGSGVVLVSAPVNIARGQSTVYQMVDQNGNVPPSGSSLSVTCDGPEAKTFNTEVPGNPGDLFGPWSVNVAYSGDDPGVCDIDVQSPNGHISRYTINVS